jgi:hypothetical protein
MLSKTLRALDRHLVERERDERRRRQRADVIEKGEHLHDCPCGQRFRSDDRYAVLCATCEAEEPGPRNEPPERERSYRFEPFKRGGFR